MFNRDIISDVPKFFGRRKGRVVRKTKSFLLDNLLPQLKIDIDGDFSRETLFAEPKENICLEIGFGDGQHIYGQAKNNPQNGYLGVEVFQNGVANLMSLISGIKEGSEIQAVDASSLDIQNVRIYDDDMRILFKNIPDNFFDKVYLLFPDPWPKKKHASRRFVNPDNLRELSRVLKSGGVFRIATDHPVYKTHVLRTMHKCADFSWLAKCGDDWRHEPSDWVKTKYQQKAIREGRRPVFFDYENIKNI